MRLAVTLFGFLSICLATTAHAGPGSNWTVKAVSCSSGTFDASKTLAIGAQIPEDSIRSLQKQEEAAFKETDKEAVLAVLVSGSNDGVCKNNDKTTLEILTFTK